MNVIITGSSGMVGKGVLLECTDHPGINKILLINRQSIGLKHPRVTEIIHKDFFNFDPIRQQLQNYQACFFCLGITSAGLKEEEYKKITYDITLALAKTLQQLNPDLCFCYVSGTGTDSSEKGNSMWARVKGKTENDLMKLFKNAYMFRPGYIQPMRGVKSKTGWYNAVYAVFKPLYFLLKPFKGFVTDTSSLGKAMIEVANNGFHKKIIESGDLPELSRN